MRFPKSNIKAPSSRSSKKRAVDTLGASFYVVFGNVSLIVVTNIIGFHFLFWPLYAVGLFAILTRLGGGKQGASCAALVLLLSVFASGVVGNVVWSDFVLKRRGNTIEALVLDERVEHSRAGKYWHYRLIRKNGVTVPGETITSDSPRFSVGEWITVIVDPQGKISPQTPGHASPVGDLVGVSGVISLCVTAVGWTGFTAGKPKRRRIFLAKKRGTAEEQVRGLRVDLQTGQFDRRGYIKVLPGKYPDLTDVQAAITAREENLKLESLGNCRPHWRFAKEVIEEVDS